MPPSPLSRCGPLSLIPRKVYQRYFEPYHRYCIEIQRQIKSPRLQLDPEREDFQLIFWWRYGTTEQLMGPSGPTLAGISMGWPENMIRAGGVEGVELAIEE